MESYITWIKHYNVNIMFYFCFIEFSKNVNLRNFVLNEDIIQTRYIQLNNHPWRNSCLWSSHKVSYNNTRKDYQDPNQMDKYIFLSSRLNMIKHVIGLGKSLCTNISTKYFWVELAHERKWIFNDLQKFVNTFHFPKNH